MANVTSLPLAQENKRKNRKECPQQSANILSRLSFWWMTKLILTGELVNVMAVNVFSIMEFLNESRLLLTTPVDIIGSVIFLYQLFGVAAIAGLAAALISVVLNFLVIRQQKQMKIDEMYWKDQRLGILSEILNGIKALKLYAWEEHFVKIFASLRKNELKWLLKGLLYRSLLTLLSALNPILLSLVTFSVYLIT